MQLELIRCVVAGATDLTIGINTRIAALTLEVGDTLPPNVDVYDCVRHGWVARKTFALEGLNIALPVIAIFVGTLELDPEVETYVRDGHIPVTFAYLDERSDTEVGLYNALQTNRAIGRFLRLFSHNSNETMRTRNGIIVQAITELSQDQVAAEKGDVFIGAATTATFLVRETSA